MVKKFVDPLISFIVLGTTICVFLFFLAGRHKLFNDQLSASIISYIEFKKEQVISEDCLEKVEKKLEEDWNKECEKQGLEDRCNLPMKTAGELINEYDRALSQCM